MSLRSSHARDRRRPRRAAIAAVLAAVTLGPPALGTSGSAEAARGKKVKAAFKSFGRAVKGAAKAGAKKVKQAAKGGKGKSR